MTVFSLYQFGGMRSNMATLTLALTHFQVVCIIFSWSFEVPWPEDVLAVIRALKAIFMLNIAVAASPECASEGMTFFDRWIFVVGYFAAVELTFIAMWGFSSRVVNWQTMKERSGKVMTILPSFAFVTLLETAMQPWLCTRQTDGSLTMDASPGMECSYEDEQWKVMYTISWVWFVSVALGVPLGMLALARAAKQSHASTGTLWLDIGSFQNAFGWMFLRFDAHNHVYEVAVLMRKCGLCLCAPLLSSDFIHPETRPQAWLQGVWGLVVLLASFSLHAWRRPFASMQDRRVATFGYVENTSLKWSSFDVLEAQLLTLEIAQIVVGLCLVEGVFASNGEANTNAVAVLFGLGGLAALLIVVSFCCLLEFASFVSVPHTIISLLLFLSSKRQVLQEIVFLNAARSPDSCILVTKGTTLLPEGTYSPVKRSFFSRCILKICQPTTARRRLLRNFDTGVTIYFEPTDTWSTTNHHSIWNINSDSSAGNLVTDTLLTLDMHTWHDDTDRTALCLNVTDVAVSNVGEIRSVAAGFVDEIEAQRKQRSKSAECAEHSGDECFKLRDYAQAMHLFRHVVELCSRHNFILCRRSRAKFNGCDLCAKWVYDGSDELLREVVQAFHDGTDRTPGPSNSSQLACQGQQQQQQQLAMTQQKRLLDYYAQQHIRLSSHAHRDITLTDFPPKVLPLVMVQTLFAFMFSGDRKLFTVRQQLTNAGVLPMLLATVACMLKRSPPAKDDNGILSGAFKITGVSDQVLNDCHANEIMLVTLEIALASSAGLFEIHSAGGIKLIVPWILHLKLQCKTRATNLMKGCLVQCTEILAALFLKFDTHDAQDYLCVQRPPLLMATLDDFDVGLTTINYHDVRVTLTLIVANPSTYKSSSSVLSNEPITWLNCHGKQNWSDIRMSNAVALKIQRIAFEEHHYGEKETKITQQLWETWLGRDNDVTGGEKSCNASSVDAVIHTTQPQQSPLPRRRRASDIMLLPEDMMEHGTSSRVRRSQSSALDHSVRKQATPSFKARRQSDMRLLPVTNETKALHSGATDNNRPANVAATMFNKLDSNGDGRISLEEFKTEIQKSSNIHTRKALGIDDSANGGNDYQIERIFGSMDIDKSNDVDLQELQRYLSMTKSNAPSTLSKVIFVIQGKPTASYHKCLGAYHEAVGYFVNKRQIYHHERNDRSLYFNNDSRWIVSNKAAASAGGTRGHMYLKDMESATSAANLCGCRRWKAYSEFTKGWEIDSNIQVVLSEAADDNHASELSKYARSQAPLSHSSAFLTSEECTHDARSSQKTLTHSLRKNALGRDVSTSKNPQRDKHPARAAAVNAPWQSMASVVLNDHRGGRAAELKPQIQQASLHEKAKVLQERSASPASEAVKNSHRVVHLDDDDNFMPEGINF
jgi:Ca2+-binding EF-hand superfamily protein